MTKVTRRSDDEAGATVVETPHAPPTDGAEEREEPANDGDGNPLAETPWGTPAKVAKPVPSERTDDPVRLYLREIGSVDLLSREGEVAIAKRIEAGRFAMIAGLCESPLTFQAIVIWRDELNDGKIFLRDIIDLEATFAGPGAEAVPAGIPGAVAPPALASPDLMTVPPPVRAPATRFAFGANYGEAPPQGATGAVDADDDDLENVMSLTAIEAELTPKVLATFDK